DIRSLPAAIIQDCCVFGNEPVFHGQLDWTGEFSSDNGRAMARSAGLGVVRQHAAGAVELAGTYLCGQFFRWSRGPKGKRVQACLADVGLPQRCLWWLSNAPIEAVFSHDLVKGVGSLVVGMPARQDLFGVE